MKKGRKKKEVKVLQTWLKANQPNAYKKLAEKLGYKSHSTIRHWEFNNNIPKCRLDRTMKQLEL